MARKTRIDKTRQPQYFMYDPRYLRGIEFFNKREFFDAHETWEELWNDAQSPEKEFVQGLIQFATALHHFEAHNLKGAKLLYEAGIELLKPFEPMFWDLLVTDLISDMTICVKPMLSYKQADLPGRYHPGKEKFPIQIKDELIPKIQLGLGSSHV